MTSKTERFNNSTNHPIYEIADAIALFASSGQDIAKGIRGSRSRRQGNRVWVTGVDCHN
jgi:hypothetical protein